MLQGYDSVLERGEEGDSGRGRRIRNLPITNRRLAEQDVAEVLSATGS